MIGPTTINRVLGTDEPLSYALVERAIEERVAEDDRLEWKQQLPADKDELAKDLTAFANARGGVLIYGVAEERGTGRASKALPIDIREPQQRRVRAVLGSRVNPPIAGVVIEVLRAAPDDIEGFLVVQVPDSPDAPHIVGTDNALGVPYRVGSDTAWMREWDLERAYRDRFARQAADEERLARLIEHTRDHIELRAGVWLVVATVPTTPLHGFMDAQDKSDAVRIVADAATLSQAACPARGGEAIGSLGEAAYNPRVGLRRWVFQDRRVNDPSGLARSIHVELHLDGTTVLACRADERDAEGIDGKHPVHDVLFTAACIDAVALAEAVADVAGHAGQTLVRAEMLRPTEAPLALVIPERHGQWSLGRHQPEWTRDVARPVPVETTIPRARTAERLLDAAKFLAGDLVAQFGYPPGHLNW